MQDGVPRTTGGSRGHHGSDVSQYGSTTTIEGDGPGGRPSAWVPRPAVTQLVVSDAAVQPAHAPSVAVAHHVPAFESGVVVPRRAPAFERDAAPRTEPVPADAADPGALASPWDHTDPRVWFRALLVPGVLLLVVVVVAVVAITSPA
ncbi:hypothetical protein [Patulibacter minatonensis]|uniref:hypothetical protein n=1 Tax=Patulibacter minatonensis TaxID=298163 RepID=UPI001B7F8A3A|nr:hypothetical protein [Patulibacter minatonensis]